MTNVSFRHYIPLSKYGKVTPVYSVKHSINTFIFYVHFFCQWIFFKDWKHKMFTSQDQCIWSFNSLGTLTLMLNGSGREALRRWGLCQREGLVYFDTVLMCLVQCRTHGKGLVGASWTKWNRYSSKTHSFPPCLLQDHFTSTGEETGHLL